MTSYISFINPIIATIIFTLLFYLNINNYSSINYYRDDKIIFINDLFLIIIYIIMIILVWLFLFIHIKYQNHYITLLYLFLAISLGTFFILYLLYRIYRDRINYYNYFINPKFAPAVIKKVICNNDTKLCKTEIEYTINNVKYSKSIFLNNYKENDKITIIYDNENLDIYDETIIIHSKIYIIILIILLILLWILFIYDINNLYL